MLKLFMSLSRRILAVATVSAITVIAIGASPALAQQKLRIGNFQNTTVTPLFHALDKGYFKAEGIDVEIVPIPGGPAAISAVMAGEADIAWAHPVPVINARTNGVPIKLALTTSQEFPPDNYTIWIVATGKSGIKTSADLKGKTVMINANGAAADLIVRDRLSGAGLQRSDIKTVVVPFPQMQAALELGNADAAVTIDSIHQPIMASEKIKAHVVATGTIDGIKSPVTSSGFFGREDWLKKNRDLLVRFGRAYEKASKEVFADRALQTALVIKITGVSKAIADGSIMSVYRDLYVKPEAIQPLIDAMAKTSMIKERFPASEVIESLAN